MTDGKPETTTTKECGCSTEERFGTIYVTLCDKHREEIITIFQNQKPGEIKYVKAD